MNSRPNNADLSNPDIPEPITLMQLLTPKSKGAATTRKVVIIKFHYWNLRWRRVQFLANQFWQRWRSEYLQTLQTRHKWQFPQCSLQVGDIVLVKENVPRNRWALAQPAMMATSGKSRSAWQQRKQEE